MGKLLGMGDGGVDTILLILAQTQVNVLDPRKN